MFPIRLAFLRPLKQTHTPLISRGSNDISERDMMTQRSMRLWMWHNISRVGSTGELGGLTQTQTLTQHGNIHGFTNIPPVDPSPGNKRKRYNQRPLQETQCAGASTAKVRPCPLNSSPSRSDRCSARANKQHFQWLKSKSPQQG